MPDRNVEPLTEHSLLDTPLPSSFDENADFYNENGLQKITRKIKREPLIPLGCILTVAAFTNAYRAMRKGDHNQVQRMFRARILAQTFTVAAMVAGGFYFGAERHKERELWKVQQAQVDEEKRMRWIRELEARDAEEKALHARLAKRRSRKAEAAAESAEAVESVDADAAKPSETGGKSVMAALGGLFSKNTAVQDKEDKKEDKDKKDEAK